MEDCDKIQISCLPIFFDPSTRLKFLTTDEHALHAFDRFPLGFPTVDPRYFQIIRPASGIKWVWSGKSWSEKKKKKESRTDIGQASRFFSAYLFSFHNLKR